MFGLPILSLIIFLPIVGAIIIAIVGRNDGVNDDDHVPYKNSSYLIAVLTTFVSFILALMVWNGFDNSLSTMQFMENIRWFSDINVSYTVGVDGISLPFVLLGTFVMPIAVLFSIKKDTKKVKELMISLLVLETSMLGIFLANDLVLFYVFFEAMLVPVFLLIGIWGSGDKVKAGLKFFLYSFLGSLFMLVAIIYILITQETTNFTHLMGSLSVLTYKEQLMLFIGFTISFAVKLPMFPVHAWQPDAYEKAPSSATIILGGALKMGVYGLIRYSFSLFPEVAHEYAMVLFVLCGIGIVYGSLVAIAQKNVKRMMVYATLAHMGLVGIGIFSGNQQGIEGAIFATITHGLTAVLLFLLIGSLFDRFKTYNIDAFGGIVNQTPRYAFVFMIGVFASVGVPGTAPFVGEILTFIGIAQVNIYVTMIAILSVVLSVCYMLYMFKHVILGAVSKDAINALKDLSSLELIVYAVLVLLIVFFGVYPAPLLKIMDATVHGIVSNYLIHIVSV